MGTLQDELEDLEEDLEDSEDITGENAGPLGEPAKSQLAGKLQSAEVRIITIQDPNFTPSLIPQEAGRVDPSVAPSTLPEFADVCYALAREARAEVLQATPDHEVIGTKLKTIKSLLPEYRDRAGIDW